MEVHSRTGVVSLKKLRLDCELLNQYMAASPLRVVEAEVGELQASISYDAILSDGCNVTCKGLVVTLAPSSASMSPPAPHPRSTNSKTTKNEKEESQHTLPKEDKHSTPSGISSEEDNVSEDSLGFIAQWIEVIIARLRVTVEDLHIILLDSPSVETSSAAIHIEFRNFTFFNSHPRLVQESGSSIMATSMMGSDPDASSSFIDAMNTRKVRVTRTHVNLTKL